MILKNEATQAEKLKQQLLGSSELSLPTLLQGVQSQSSQSQETVSSQEKEDLQIEEKDVEESQFEEKIENTEKETSSHLLAESASKSSNQIDLKSLQGIGKIISGEFEIVESLNWIEGFTIL